MHHFVIGDNAEFIRSMYLSWIVTTEETGPIDHPGSYSARGNGPLTFHLYHGRFDPDQTMEEWGFDGPHFDCLAVVHDRDRVLLQGCTAESLSLAEQVGLATAQDTIILDYHNDMILVPAFSEGEPAYFGDHFIGPTQ